jgi:hypothetical protein
MDPGLCSNNPLTKPLHCVPLCATHLVQLLDAAAVDDDDHSAPQQEAGANDHNVPAVANQLTLAW